jgi:hypothetical protein
MRDPYRHDNRNVKVNRYRPQRMSGTVQFTVSDSSLRSFITEPIRRDLPSEPALTLSSAKGALNATCGD